MALGDFKSTYYLEWGPPYPGPRRRPRIRPPAGLLVARRRLARTLRTPLLGVVALLGAQGALGWYMVRSGLEETGASGGGENAVLRVSQYRLAVHLRIALALYAGMFAAALSVIADWRFARDGAWGRLRDGRTWDGVLRNPLARRFKAHAAIVTGLVFLTALSGTSITSHTSVWDLNLSPGAFVAGLDAGLVYNEFSLMGGHLAPFAQLRRHQRQGQGCVAQSLREPDDGAVRPPRARNDDVSCNGAALRVEPARSCPRSAPPTRGARRDGRVRDGERAGSARHLHAALPRAGTASRNAPSRQSRTALGRASRAPGTTPARRRCTGVASGQFDAHPGPSPSDLLTHKRRCIGSGPLTLSGAAWYPASASLQRTPAPASHHPRQA